MTDTYCWVSLGGLGEWRRFTPRPKNESRSLTPGPQAFKILKAEGKLNDLVQ